jgi:hypothetical protein
MCPSPIIMIYPHTKNSESRGKKPTRKKLVREVFDHRYFIEGNVVKIS